MIENDPASDRCRMRCIQCDKCRGRGLITTPCQECGGHSCIDAKTELCSTCHGTGYRWEGARE